MDEDFLFNQDLAEIDPDTDLIIRFEEQRQHDKLIMIASESICPKAVRTALASVFTNLYAEGYPHRRMTHDERDLLLDFKHQIVHSRRYADRRYYRGCDYVNFVEALAQKRVCELFATREVPADRIFANVQPLSGAAANNAVYEGFLEEGDAVMGMALNNGGHLTHGSEANRSGRRYHIVPYEADRATGRVDYDTIARLAEEHGVRMIIAGYSAYPWDVDWKRLREVADSVPSRPIIMADIAHPAGLVIADCFPNPIGYADVVTFTTHKTLCGPRGAVILTTDPENAKRVDAAVFPGEQGGPHINNVAAKAVAFQIAGTPAFRRLQEKIYQNAQDLAHAIEAQGLKLAYRGTASHMLLIDLKSVPASGRSRRTKTGVPLRGEVASRILDLCGITCNKNTIAGDDNAVYPSAIRLGTTWVTQRGMGKPEMEKIAELICRTLKGIRAFDYIGRVGALGRGKIDYGLMANVRREVALLTRGLPRDSTRTLAVRYPHFLSHPVEEGLGPSRGVGDTRGDRPRPCTAEELKAARETAAVFDMADCGLVEVQGFRADLFLQEAGTANIAAMNPGRVRGTAFIGADGNLVDDAILLRLRADNVGRYRYLLIANSENTARLTEWLRSLSDGYVLFDEEDVYAKVRGPVVVDGLGADRPEERRTAIGIAGPNAGDVISNVQLEAGPLEAGHFSRGKVRGADVLVGRLDGEAGGLDYFLLVHPDRAPAVWQSLVAAAKEAGGGPAGIETRARVRADAGLPVYDGKPMPASSLQGKAAGLYDLGKTCFIGHRLLRANGQARPARPRFEWTGRAGPLKRTPLYEEHLKLAGKGRLIPFAGWEMPVWYRSISEEHRAVRTAAGLFDVAHMGVLEIAGPNAAEFLDVVTTNHVRALKPGQCCYSYLLDVDGIPHDDVTIYCVDPRRYMMVVNAVNTDKVLAWLHAVNRREVVIDLDHPRKQIDVPATIRDLADPDSGDDRKVDLALQGPRSLDILMRVIAREEDQQAVAALSRFEFADVQMDRGPVRVARTGYTGEEFGYELYVHPDRAVDLWRAVLERGADLGVQPTGLGARDSTRIEAGLPLYGHELAGDHGITPIEAGYGAFVKFHKPFFIGRSSALRNMLQRKMQIARFRVESARARAVHPGHPVVARKGQVIGAVTSCALVEGRQIGLAYMESRFAEEDTLIGIFILPRGKPKPEKPKDELAVGDRVLLHEEAVILPRTPVRT